MTAGWVHEGNHSFVFRFWNGRLILDLLICCNRETYFVITILLCTKGDQNLAFELLCSCNARNMSRFRTEKAG